MKLPAYCLDWHIKSSDAFKDLIVTPLEGLLDVQLTAWDGESLPSKPKKDATLIFCMLPPSEDLLRRSDLNLVWIPMWDQAQGYDDAWWQALPKNLRVIAYSNVVYEKARRAGLDVLRLSYHKNPADFTPASWDNGNIVYYWNRVGMIGPDFLEKLCSSLRATELLFKPNIDPRIEKNKYYELPPKIGNTKVTILKSTKSREAFISQIEGANIVISPRLTEGAGMVFLESLARGCAVIAHDAPTMNEYITHGQTGILLKKSFQKRSLWSKSPPQYDEPFLVTPFQNWRELSKFNYQKIGRSAKAAHQQGYAKWVAKKDDLLKFITK